MSDRRVDKVLSAAGPNPSRPMNLSKLNIPQLLVAYQNAVTKLADKRQSKWHRAAQKQIDAIKNEWTVRRALAIESGEYFSWPKTSAVAGRRAIDAAEWERQGLLKYLGYSVGGSGLSTAPRRLILDDVFAGPLPPIISAEYMGKWGVPATAGRLKQLATEIASFARNANRRRDAAMYAAAADWQSDLEYLRIKYYVGRFGFGWPTPFPI
jgi:hypothetical protein